MDQRVWAAHERRLMADAIGVEAQDILVELQLVGYKAETITLVELAPALAIAWADGRISKREHDTIARIAPYYGVAGGTRMHSHLNCWLDAPPSSHLFAASIRAVRAMLDALQPDVREAIRRRLIADYTAVAASSGDDLFGRTIATNERTALNYVIAALKGAGDDV